MTSALVSNPGGMKRFLAELEHGLGLVGVKPNATKSSSLRLMAFGKRKAWAVDPNPYLTLDRSSVPTIDVASAYKYLGVTKGIGKKGRSSVMPKLGAQLQQLFKVPIKPQQRIYFLRIHVVPGLYYELVLGRYSKGLLFSLDRMVRAAVRRWLHVPHDMPTAFFHAHATDGGLGLPQLVTQVPLMRLDRVERLFRRATQDRDPVTAVVIKQCRTLKAERARWSDGVKCYDDTVTSKASRRQATASALHASCDGAGLLDMSQVPAVNRWVSSGSRLMTGKSFVDAVNIRGGCLYTKVRAWRGGRPVKSANGRHTVACDMCPGRRETLCHIVQQCPESAHARLEGHNSQEKFHTRKLSAKGFTCVVEPAIKTVDGVRRPGIIVYKTANDGH